MNIVVWVTMTPAFIKAQKFMVQFHHAGITPDAYRGVMQKLNKLKRL